MKAVILVCLAFLVAACETPQMQSLAPSGSGGAIYVGSGNETASLFTGDAGVISDADIDRILKFQYQPPKQIRIAVLPFERETWFGYSDELARTGNEVRTRLLDQLRSNPRVSHAAFLPTLLIPSNRAVPRFREAAARYQADLLLIYQTSCRTYDRYRVFAADQSKSYCNVEALLLDTRTGIVPFTTTASKEFTTTQSRTDTNFHETMRKAELSAIRDALMEVGTQAATFLAATNSG